MRKNPIKLFQYLPPERLCLLEQRAPGLWVHLPEVGDELPLRSVAQGVELVGLAVTRDDPLRTRMQRGSQLEERRGRGLARPVHQQIADGGLPEADLCCQFDLCVAAALNQVAEAVSYGVNAQSRRSGGHE